MLKVELHTEEIPDIFSRFENIVDQRYWMKRNHSIRAEIRSKPFLLDHLEKENAVAFGLARCSDLVTKYGRIPMQATENHEIYPAISLAAQTLSVIDHSSNREAEKVVQRIRGAFQNPADMRALQMEMMAATHFVRRGLSIAWPEMEGLGQFDLLVKELGTDGLEIECKSVSEDKGRRIHRREALEFHHLLKLRLQPLSQNLRAGVAVVLTVPDRLPTTYKQKQDLANRIAHAVLSSQSVKLDDGCDIRVSEFSMADLAVSHMETGPVISREAIDRVTGTKNREAMILGHANGAIILVLQSRRDDTMLSYLFKALSDSAKNQLSKNRPAIFLVGLHGIQADGLLNLATLDNAPGQAPTALRLAVSDFLSSDSRDWVVGVAFLSASALTPKRNGVVDSGGTAYFFPKTGSAFWNENISGLFS